MLEELKESFEKWRQTNLLSIKKNRNNIKEKLYQHSQEYATLKCEANQKQENAVLEGKLPALQKKKIKDNSCGLPLAKKQASTIRKLVWVETVVQEK